MFDLIRVNTCDDLLLCGLFLPCDRSKPLVLHIHGFEGNFFINQFISDEAAFLKSHDSGFLSIQTRGTASDYVTLTTHGSWQRVGAHYESLQDSEKDIDAFLKYILDLGYTNIYLQGHSLGTVKAVRYLFQGTYKEHIKKLVLLSTPDNVGLAEIHTKGKFPEYIEEAKARIKKGKGEDIIPRHYYVYPMSYQTFVSWLDTDVASNEMFSFYNKKYPFQLLQKITVPVLVVNGSKDTIIHPSNPTNPSEAMKILGAHIHDCLGTLIEGSGHGFIGYERELIVEISKFLAR